MKKIVVSAVALSALAALVTVSPSASAGGGGSGYLFTGPSSGFTCASADGRVEAAISDTATVNGSRVRLSSYQIDVTERVAYLTGEQLSATGGSTWVTIPVRRGANSVSPAGAVTEAFKSRFDVPGPAARSAIANFTSAFSHRLATRWLDDDTIEIDTPFSAEGVCADEDSVVRTSFRLWQR